MSGPTPQPSQPGAPGAGQGPDSPQAAGLGRIRAHVVAKREEAARLRQGAEVLGQVGRSVRSLSHVVREHLADAVPRIVAELASEQSVASFKKETGGSEEDYLKAGLEAVAIEVARLASDMVSSMAEKTLQQHHEHLGAARQIEQSALELEDLLKAQEPEQLPRGL